MDRRMLVLQPYAFSRSIYFCLFVCLFVCSLSQIYLFFWLLSLSIQFIILNHCHLIWHTHIQISDDTFNEYVPKTTKNIITRKNKTIMFSPVKKRERERNKGHVKDNIRKIKKKLNEFWLEKDDFSISYLLHNSAAFSHECLMPKYL